MQFLRWKDVTNSQNFHLTSFSFPSLRTYCSSLTRCRVFHAVCQIWISWQANAIGPTRCRVIIRVKLPELIALPCEGLVMYYSVHQTLVVETFEESFESFGFQLQSECCKNKPKQKGQISIPSLRCQGRRQVYRVHLVQAPAVAKVRQFEWLDVPGVLGLFGHCCLQVRLSWVHQFQAIPTLASVQRARHPRWRQSVWLRKNWFKFVSGVHKSCSMNCILYILRTLL